MADDLSTQSALPSSGATRPESGDAPGAQVPLPPMSPPIWGTPEESKPLPESILGLLREVLGVDTESVPTCELSGVRIPPVRLTPADLEALGVLVGPAAVSTDVEQRLRRAAGKSTPDLLAWRFRTEIDAPDAVLAPRTEDEVLEVLQWCAANSVAVVPFGGGTSVVGGLRPDAGAHRAVLSLDLAHFSALEEIDTVSGEAVLGAGCTGPRAEELLRERGYSLGHFPQSFPYASVGGFAMTRSSGQDSAGYGRFDEMVRGLTVVTPVGIWRAGRAPASAAGPDLRHLLLGSEGTFGVCTSVRVRIHPQPAETRHAAYSFPDFATGAAALRAVEQQGTGPTVIRLSDESETAVNLATTDKIGDDATQVQGCLCVTMFEGTHDHVESRLAETGRVLEQCGGVPLGPELAQAWEHGRFGAPVLRDSLLDAGALCETLETATDWSNLDHLKQAVTTTLTDALRETGTDSIVLAHISHVYPTGASLYFTVVAAQRGDDPIAQWRGVKEAVNTAIVGAGGTITHHHAVGRDHLPGMSAEVGEVGVAVLRAVKQAVDPTGIMNPGTLIP